MDVAPNETLLSMDLVSNDALPLSFLPSAASSLPLLPRPLSVLVFFSLLAPDESKQCVMHRRSPQAEKHRGRAVAEKVQLV